MGVLYFSGCFLPLFNSNGGLSGDNSMKPTFKEAKERMKGDCWDFAKRVEPIFQLMNYKTMTPRGLTVPIPMEIYAILLRLIDSLTLNTECKHGEFAEISSAYMRAYYNNRDDEPFEYGLQMIIDWRNYN